MRRLEFLCLTLLALMTTSLDVLAQIAEHKVNIYSAGVRMAGTVLYPQALEGKKLPKRLHILRICRLGRQN